MPISRRTPGTPTLTISFASAAHEGQYTCDAINACGTATSASGATVMLNGSASYDPDGDALQYHWDVSDFSVILDDPDSSTPSGVFRIGVTMATLTVVDGNGGVATCDVVITVTDTTPPVLNCTTDFAMLWPPDHTLRQVTLFVVATDAAQSLGSVRPTVFLRSDEPDDVNGNGDGNTTGDVNGFDGFLASVDVSHLFAWNPAIGDYGAWVATVQLRAERAGAGDGRCYTIDSVGVDGSGNTGLCSSCVVVPHDRRPE